MRSTVPATLTVRPGHQLVPALIGQTNATTTAVHIECPTWCDESDHVTEPVAHAEDITHVSEPDDIVVQTFLGRGTRHILWATIQADPVADDPRQRAAHVVVEDGSDYSYLTEDMADALADDLIAFAGAVRQKARIARLHNQTVDSSAVRSQADEALRRVRPWLELKLSDLDTMPVSRLLKVFGVTVIEDGTVPDGKTAALTGKPGSMTLSYQQDVTQAEREQAVRTLLADHVAVSR